MSSPDRPAVPDPAAPAPRILTAYRRDGADPRPLADRLRMLAILTGIVLAVTIPALAVTGIFGQRPRQKPRSEPGPALRTMLEQSAVKLFPEPTALTPEPLTLTVRPGHAAARAETIARQAARFGGVATEGVANGEEKRLFVDLPAAAAPAFRLAVNANAPVDPASPAPSPALSPTNAATVGQEHFEIIIRPARDDE